MAKKFLGEEGTDAIINRIKEKTLTDAPVLIRINDIYDPLLEKMPSNLKRKYTAKCLDGAKLYECLADANNPKSFYAEVQYMTNTHIFITNNLFIDSYAALNQASVFVQFMISQGNTMFYIRYICYVTLDHKNKIATIDETREEMAQTISMGCMVYPEAYRKPAAQQWTEDYWGQ